jgi:hypothetical protein
VVKTAGFNINWFKISGTANGRLAYEETTSSDLQEPEIAVYPNPTSDKIFISSLSPDADVNIYNGMGQVVSRFKGSDLSANGFVDITSWQTGVYVIQVKQAGKTNRIKMIKK